MFNRLHSKVEHIIIHLVAVLFTLSTITASFLGYTVYQSSENQSKFFQNALAIGFFSSIWVQDSWTGGSETSNPTFVVPWVKYDYAVGGWNKYYSAQNVVINSSGVKDDGSGSGELISSIFDFGSRRYGGFSKNLNSDITQIRVGNSLGEVLSAPWRNCIDDSLNYRYVQYKMSNLSSTSYVSRVYAVSAWVLGVVRVKDASTGAHIGGATITNSVDNTVPVSEVPEDEYYGYAFEYNSNIPNMTVTVSATGYESQTKPISIIHDCQFLGSDLTFNLSKPSTSPPSTPSPPSSESVNVGTGSSSPTSFDSTIVPLVEFQQIKLSAEFVASGSQTTDLSKITDHKNVQNFILHVPSKNLIVFKDALDLSARSTVDALRQLDQYVKLTSVGTIQVDSKAMPALNKKATITMEGLSFISTPEILIDGQKDTQNVVSNVQYDPTKGVLIFDVAHFSALQAVPKIELLKPNIETVSDPNVNFRFRVSDPNAKVSGSFNGVKLADITPDPKTGEFTVKKLAFTDGENILKLTAQSNLGKVTPFVLKIKYNPKSIVQKPTNLFFSAPALYAGLSALIFAILLGYLLYRRRKRHEKLAPPPQSQTTDT